MASSSSSSSRYLTLEEFVSSPSPLPTVLVPRPHALRLLELCELAEMTQSSSSGDDFLDLIDGGMLDGDDDGVAAVANVGINDGGGGNRHVLVTQMALLVYLGEYAHARHLWRRHRDDGNDETDNAAAAANDVVSNDRAQLELMWSAARSVCAWSDGGVRSLSSSSSPLASSDGSATDDNANNSMQVEGEGPEDGNGGDDADLPLSTLALRALRSCASSGTEPLSTYSSELTGVFRSRVNRRLRESFDRLDRGEFRLRLNLYGEEDGGTSDGERPWEVFGWKEEGGYLVSDVDAMTDDEEEDSFLAANESEGDRIRKLTDIVMFLEGKMNY